MALQVRAKLYDFVAQVTNWKPKGAGICTLTLAGDSLKAVDEGGTEVLDLQLTPHMLYSRAAATFHTLQLSASGQTKAGIALYFGSQGSDEWFDAGSVAFAGALEAELSRLGSVPASAPAPAPAVPSRSPRPPPAMPAPAPKTPPTRKKPAKVPAKSAKAPKAKIAKSETVHVEVAQAAEEMNDTMSEEVSVQEMTAMDSDESPGMEAPPPIPSLPPIEKDAEALSSSDNRATLMLGGAPILTNDEGEPQSNSPVDSVQEAKDAEGANSSDDDKGDSDNDEMKTPELTRTIILARPEDRDFDLSGEHDFSTMDVLPSLPATPPPLNTKEYKNYMKLKYEHARRNPDMAPPQMISPRAPPVSQRRGTGTKGRPGGRPPPLKRAKTPPSVRSEESKPRPLSPKIRASPPPVVRRAQSPPSVPEPAQSQENTPRAEDQEELAQISEAVPEAKVDEAEREVISSADDKKALALEEARETSEAVEPPTAVLPTSESLTDADRIQGQLDAVSQFPDGSRYVGPVEAGLKHGQGFLVYCDGSTFSGQFVRGKRHGLGTRTSSDDRAIFLGHYEGDDKSGPGWVFGGDGSELFCYFSLNDKNGCGSFRWPRGSVEDREYSNGTIVATSKTDDTTWPPPFSTGYEKPQGRTQKIVWQGPSARLVCVAGSWDNFAKVLPLGFDNETRVHSLCVVLPPNETYTFSFIVDGKTGCLDQANTWPIAEGAHVLRAS